MPPGSAAQVAYILDEAAQTREAPQRLFALLDQASAFVGTGQDNPVVQYSATWVLCSSCKHRRALSKVLCSLKGCCLSVK